MLYGSLLGRAVRLRAAAAHAQTLRGPRQSEGEFKETWVSRQRAPPRGRGYRHHAWDSGAAHSGGPESAGGEARPEDRQEGHRATASRAWAQPCLHSADPGPRIPHPHPVPPTLTQVDPRTPPRQLGETHPSVARELSSPSPEQPASPLRE